MPISQRTNPEKKEKKKKRKTIPNASNASDVGGVGGHYRLDAGTWIFAKNTKRMNFAVLTSSSEMKDKKKKEKPVHPNQGRWAPVLMCISLEYLRCGSVYLILPY